MAQVPYIVHPDPGTHWLCSCGQSQNFSYCDSSDKGSVLKPLELELEALTTL